MVSFDDLLEIDSGVPLNISDAQDFENLSKEVFDNNGFTINKLNTQNIHYFEVTVYKDFPQGILKRLFSDFKYYQYSAILKVDKNTKEHSYYSKWSKGLSNGVTQLQKKEWPINKVNEVEILQSLKNWKAKH